MTMQNRAKIMRKWENHNAAAQRIGVLLFESFSNHCLANTVEPLRAANTLSGRVLFDWRFLTLDGAPVSSSSGLQIAPHGKLAEASGDMLAVMPSYDFKRHANAATTRGLRSAARRFLTLAGFDTGSWLLAEAGLLTGRRATIHWEELGSFAEQFPDVETVRERYVIDSNRITCSGAMAAFDLVMEMIGQTSGEALRLEVATLFMSPGVSAPQNVGLARTKTVSRAVALMQEHLEEPLSIGEIARRVGRSQKDLEARMKADLGASPQTVYRRFRLILARKLVLETELPVGEIALRSGYQNASSMTRAFREEFGIAPRHMRSG